MNNNKKYIVYMDGVFDLFHRGHIEAINKAKNIRDDVYLIIGIVSDNDATDYKRKPIFHEDDRFKIISSIKGIDQIVFPAPLIIKKEFVKKYNIDIIVHSFSDTTDLKKQEEFYKDVSDIFEMIPYFPYTSTSIYIDNIYSKIAEQKNLIKF